MIYLGDNIPPRDRKYNPLFTPFSPTFMVHSISPSELIINPDGSIFHLHIKPGQLATKIITVGDPQRADIISSYFTNIESVSQNREFKTITGYYEGQRISIVSTGIGPDNIDIVMNEIDACFNINFETRQVMPHITPLTFIRMGTSGGLHPSVQLDEIILSQLVIGLDNIASYYTMQDVYTHKQLKTQILELCQSQHIAIQPYVTGTSQGLLQHFGSIGKRGITLTAPGFYGPQGRNLRLSSTLRPLFDPLRDISFEGLCITNFEMETSAIYTLAHALGHEAISLNTIIAQRHDGQFSAHPHISIRRMIESALPLVASL